ncbi:helix-turn-helix transcriptional regulator [Mycolicibacterium conceptionense]|uniref:helix-turn-helix transcriptional regulator n=1 Tax=Mycolicibacterium conceptionense TaxID=451644 RepID=UPI000AC57004|nr:XRE family transcriptional regulator [Mycolicibacterium conceptionense]
MVRYLTITEFAERAGLSRNTLKSYANIPGRLPEPDAIVGRVQGWLPETVDAWIAKRS